jgi:hypothetical protein
MNKLSGLLNALLFLFLIIISSTVEFIWMILRLPIRLSICKIRGHEWVWLGNGFFGMFAPKKNFKCKICGFKTKHPENHKTVKHQQSL